MSRGHKKGEEEHKVWCLMSCMECRPAMTYAYTLRSPTRKPKLTRRPRQRRSAAPTEVSLKSAQRVLTYLEAGHTVHNARHHVELLLGTLVVVTLALESDAYALGGRFDTTGPNSLVETGRDADVLHTHRLLRELDNGLDGLGRLCEE